MDPAGRGLNPPRPPPPSLPSRNLFTGWYDAKLTDLGRNEALSGAKSLIANGQTEFDIAFTSDLSRAQETCKIILTELGLQGKIEVKHDLALNERNYGDLTGLNKDDAKAKWGAEQVVRPIRFYLFFLCPPARAPQRILTPSFNRPVFSTSGDDLTTSLLLERPESPSRCVLLWTSVFRVLSEHFTHPRLCALLS